MTSTHSTTCDRCGHSPAPFRKGSLKAIGEPYKNGKRRQLWSLDEVLCMPCATGKPQPRPQQPATAIAYNREHGQFDVLVDSFVVGRAPSHIEGEQAAQAALQAMRNECLTARELGQLWSDELELRYETARAELAMQHAEAQAASVRRGLTSLPARVAAYEADLSAEEGRVAA